MSTIPAREIKRRGISAVDEDLRSGPVQVIQHDEVRYVVLNLEQYNELKEAYEEALIARVRAAQDEMAAGKFQRMTAQDLIDELAE
jgi:hypothetical protein